MQRVGIALGPGLRCPLRPLPARPHAILAAAPCRPLVSSLPTAQGTGVSMLQSARSRWRQRGPATIAPAAAAAAAPLGSSGAADAAAGEGEGGLVVSDVARENLRKAANACRRYGWISFWTQLVLTTIASIILLFSLAFTTQNSPSISLYLTLFGIIMGFLSTFWSFGYTRLSTKLSAFLAASSLEAAPKIRRSDVINMLEKGAIINVLGASATLLALQATIGLLVAKTLTSATVNPFMATNTTAWNPVLAFDVFNVQSTTNALLSHFFSLIMSLWLLRVIANRPSAASVIIKPTRANK